MTIGIDKGGSFITMASIKIKDIRIHTPGRLIQPDLYESVFKYEVEVSINR